MKHAIWIFIIFSLSISVYAENVLNGAQKYDWQECLNDKAGDCKNHCQASEDKDCSHNCDTMATDKCKTLGLIPPP